MMQENKGIRDGEGGQCWVGIVPHAGTNGERALSPANGILLVLRSHLQPIPFHRSHHG